MVELNALAFAAVIIVAVLVSVGVTAWAMGRVLDAMGYAIEDPNCVQCAQRVLRGSAQQMVLTHRDHHFGPFCDANCRNEWLIRDDERFAADTDFEDSEA